ncbi:uncharacterized protein LOC121727505 isoform X2 [Aricia agestis]|uniref:uncharacterized protein LOC121727505 isoform X2 n=1 Tax=Aricia agestis TaxID=91739 RepID=UPI001C20B009|nr:uncharacterized protein LOC121727505 isoform X2 [Aricia agestis]
MPQCCALNCKNQGVHIFPKDPKRRKKWENALRIKNFKASNSARLCSFNFTKDDYFGRSKYTDAEPHAKFLRKTAVPSVFSFTQTNLENPAALERQHRLEKRSQRILLYFNQQLQPNSQPTTSEEVFTDITSAVGCEKETVTKNSPIGRTLGTISEHEHSTKSTQVDQEYIYGSIKRFTDDDKSIQFYTGFESYKKFQFVFATLSPMAHKIKYYYSNVINLSVEDQFFLTMMKLRQNKCNFELSKFFNISETTVTNIFITWANFIHQLWSRLNIWPSKKLVKYYMPEHFKKFEVLKQKNPSGDTILADRGFTVQDNMFADRNISVRIPTFLKGKSQLPGLTVIKDRELASKHVHIERIIELTKTYKILKSELDHNFIPIASKIFFICFMCCNFREYGIL